MDDSNLFLMLERHRDVDREYISDKAECLSYRQTLQAVERIGHVAEVEGIGQQHVALIAENSVQYVCAYWMLLKRQCVVVPVSAAASDEEALSQIRYTDCTWIVAHGSHLELGLRLASALSLGLLYIAEGRAQVMARPTRRYGLRAASGTAVMIYTSGSTSQPKRVMLSHSALVQNVMMHNTVAELSHADRTILCLPIEFGYAQGTQLLNATLVGASVHLRRDRHFDPNAFLKLCRNIEPTFLTVVPSLLRLLEMALQPKDERVGSLRKIFFGGSPSHPNTLRSWRTKAPHIALMNTYGMTECGPRISTARPDDTDDHSLGYPLPGVRVRSVSAESGVQDGEIEVSTPSMMLGYYQQPGETAASFSRDGWFRTGDLGYVAADGRLLLTGRVKNVVIVGGMNVSCEEIEAAALATQDIAEARSCGIFDEGDEYLSWTWCSRRVLILTSRTFGVICGSVCPRTRCRCLSTS